MSELSDALATSWMQLQSSWRATREVWRDQVADAFESEHIAEWERVMSGAIDSLAELERTLAEALRHTQSD
jgi:hypothetical protein